MQQDVPTRFLTLPEVATILRLGKSSVYRLINNGELASIHLGARHLVSRRVLDAYIERLEGRSYGQTRAK